ncbi:DmpA family aminopeptidase [Radiobacillus deserti]|uniref:P1 family peptidase n=1 Tax=Radiobacillus deserti TaxID=2594883 RepID=A0A516KHS7_9BACI|nr:P1 family peptidase [Radiobacillus deserti]QDP40948.1 P1 family peptidase [Radiobacillus deserti]
MKKQKRIREYGIHIGEMTVGPKNSITDVDGVTVGQVTLSNQDTQTGVTAVLPHQGNIFQEKVLASTHVINGFGKTTGSIQVTELGTIETPIILTNTLSVGLAADALIDYMLEQNPKIGQTTGTVNPVVGECNDMFLNSIRAKKIKKDHIFQAIHTASSTVEEGTVGAGTGMLCYSLKGGVGTSSRIMELDHGTYTLGVLVVTNFGILHDLTIQGNQIGKALKEKILPSWEEKDKGSIMMVVATDLPVSERQLNRILKRTSTGLARTGSIITNGSGEIAIGFTTANKVSHQKTGKISSLQTIHEEEIDEAFRAVGEATEEAVINSLITATAVTGRDGNKRPALKDLLKSFQIPL